MAVTMPGVKAGYADLRTAYVYGDTTGRNTARRGDMASNAHVEAEVRRIYVTY